MNILVIGGTIFLGRHFVEAALRRGHTITLFNRGKHNADLFPGVEKLHGDRNGDLEILRGRSWDAVLDTSGYFPRQVRTLAETSEKSAREIQTLVAQIKEAVKILAPLGVPEKILPMRLSGAKSSAIGSWTCLANHGASTNRPHNP